jgi:hypothetical protein
LIKYNELSFFTKITEYSPFDVQHGLSLKSWFNAILAGKNKFIEN